MSFRGFDTVFTWARVVSSSVASVTKATLYNLAGIGSDDPEDEDTDELGEAATEQEVLTSLGIIARPRAPKKGTDDITRFAEALGIRTTDGLLPIGMRDRRLHERFPAPKEGTIALVGYGGAFLSFDDTATDSGDEKATLATLYVPYEYSNGVAGKAHALLLDPLEEAVSLIHGDGSAAILTSDAALLRSPDGSAFIEVRNGKVIISAPQLVCRGGLLIGSEAGPAFPIAYISGGPQPSTLLQTSG